MNYFFSDALARLGFQQRLVKGVEVILPPTVLIPTGIFTMGSDPKKDLEAKRRNNEFPRGREDLMKKGPRVLRGSDWMSPLEYLRVALRGFDHHDLEISRVGFRLANRQI
jgi:formylglycine-generating enzyme required for sulfatase activity